MLAKAVVIYVVVALCKCDCILESDKLKCDYVSFNEIMDTYGDKGQIKELHLSNCNLKTLRGQLVPFENLQVLDMSCGIERVAANALSNLRYLQKLSLKHNSIKRIPNAFFESLENLKKLVLSHNLYRNPQPFEFLADLEELDLSWNRIGNIDTITFDTVVNLRKLYLNNNAISSLISGTFDDVNKLEVLDVSYNIIDFIYNDIFQENINLKTLIINNNPIFEVSPNAFKKNKELLFIDMRYLNITKLEPGFFDSLQKLTTLKLGGNRVETMPLGLFNTLTYAETIDMSLMDLKIIRNTLFKLNVNLKRLDVSRNKILSVQDESFAYTQLGYFNVSNNKLQSISVKYFDRATLKEIDFSFNDVEQLDSELLHLPNLEAVYARGNKLYTLEYNANINIPIRHIDLRHNRLVYVNNNFFGVATNLNQMEIIGNPWECKCMDEMLMMFKKFKIDYSKDDYFSGQRSTCVILSNTCPIDEGAIKRYYDLYNNA